MVRVVPQSGGLRVEAPAYSLTFAEDTPFATLRDAAGAVWAELFLAGGLHTAEGLDDTAALRPPVWTREGDRVTVSVEAVSNRWEARSLVFTCCPDHLTAAVRVRGEGRLTDCHLFGGYHSGHLRAGSGFHRSRRRFRALFNPEPTTAERRAISAAEPAVIDVLQNAGADMHHWFFTPAPFCYAVSLSEPEGDALPAGPWLSLGLAVRPGAYTFTGFHYEGGQDAFSLRLSYEGMTAVSGDFETPAVVLQFGAPDPYTALHRYRERLEAMGLVPAAAPRRRPTWWQEPIFCGWGAQCCLAEEAGGRPQDYARQELYDRFLRELEQERLRPGIVVIDDKWQGQYGTCVADPAKWPDLRGWIARRHATGQKVLLWWKAWDPEGLPPEQCVRNAAGVPVAADPTNPAYLATLREAVERMLGSEGYDADGFKVDFTARTPSGPGLTRHGDAWGVELLRLLLAALYREAKRVKPDALVITHTPNPYFADVSDMIRLNDVNTGAPVLPQMRHRAQVARAACPSLLIDTDNWPMPSRAAWRDYLAVQAELGVPSLYFTTHVNREPLEATDYDGLRRLWQAVRSRKE